MNELKYYEDYLLKKRKYEVVKTQHKILLEALKTKSIDKLSEETQKKYIQFMKVYQKIQDGYNLSAINVGRIQKNEKEMSQSEYDGLIEKE